MKRMLLALAAILGASPALAAPEIVFASVEEASTLLGARDAFVARLSAFDRAARLQSADTVTESEYLEFVRGAARAWTADERRRVEAAFTRIEPALTALLPPLERPILIVKTTGSEEGGAGGYTRANAVILPEVSLAGDGLDRTLAHEIFHVVSRSHPDLRRALYASIGFEYCGEVTHPAPLAARRMTNPDAPVNDHCIRLEVDGEPTWAVPILYSSEPRYDPAAERSFFQYLTFEMLLVERPDSAPARPIVRDGSPVTVPISAVAGFFEQVGRNTDYIIHPEEILASNFAMLVLGDSGLPSRDVLERMREILEAAGRQQRR